MPSKSKSKKSTINTKEIEKMIDNKLNRKIETKVYTQSFVNYEIDQRLELANQEQFLFQPAQGTGQGDRIGNSVYLKHIRFSGVMTVKSNMDYPHILKFIMYRLKSTIDLPSNADLDEIIQIGNTSTHLGELLINCFRPFNLDKFKIIKQKTVKLAKADHNAGTSNNDYLFTYYFNWKIPVNKKILFNDSSLIPENWGMYMGGACVRADGQIASPQSDVVNINADATYVYHDL